MPPSDWLRTPDPRFRQRVFTFEGTMHLRSTMPRLNCGTSSRAAVPFRPGVCFERESGVRQPSSTEGSHSESAGTAWTMARDTSIATKNGALPMATSLNGRCLAMPWIT